MCRGGFVNVCVLSLCVCASKLSVRARVRGRLRQGFLFFVTVKP